MSQNKKAVIIGAGPAGLTAGYELLKNSDIHPVILEESNQIGGISKTVNYNGNRIDIGGHRFFSKNQDVMDLWFEVMPLQGKPAYDDIKLDREVELKDGGPDPEKEDRVMLERKRVSRIFYLGKFFDYPVSLKFETIKNMGFFRTLKAGFGYIGSIFHKRKETNLENFYINRFGKPLYQMFFEKYTTKVWGREPSEIDASWGAQRVKGLSLFKTLLNAIAKPFHKKDSKHVETSLISSFYYPKKGPGQLYETMAELVKQDGGEILMESKVSKIELKDNKVVSISYIDSKGQVVKILGDYFISSMPLKDLIFAMGKDNVPTDVYEVAKGLVYRDFITVGLLVNKFKIKNKTKIKTLNNIIPDTWIYIQEEDVKLGRIQIFNNWSPYMNSRVDDTIWIGLEYFATEGDELWNMSDKDFIAMAKEELEKIEIIDKEDVIDATRINVKKAYPAYFDTYKDIDVIVKYINSISNLYCVGRNGQHRYNNMDHSMLTAMETVKVILSDGKLNKDIVWNVNVEKEYHEQK